MTFYIKNMVCNRCTMVVKQLLHNMQIDVKSVDLGIIETKNSLTKAQIKALDAELQMLGFEILRDDTRKQIEKVKKLIILKVNDKDIDSDFRLSQFISQSLHKDYSAISKSFSQVEGITLEQYFILQKIEKAKELILYNEQSLTEVASLLGYKSVQHLSAQFKNITGFTPTSFKKQRIKLRLPIDKVF